MALGLVIGLGVAAKPTALPVIAMVAALTSDRLRSLAVATAVIGVAWLPFVLAAPATLLATAWHIDVQTWSVLGAVGLSGESPWWVRPGQALLATSLTFLLARRGEVLPAIVAVVVGRLALEPGWFAYQGAGLVVVLCAWELAQARWRLPIATAATLVIAVEAVHLALPNTGLARVVLTGGLLIALVTLAVRPQSRASCGLTSRIRARSPLMNEGDSSVESDLASPTASEIATAAGTSADHRIS